MFLIADYIRIYVAEIFGRGGRAYMQHRLAVGPQEPTAFRISDQKPQTKLLSLES